MVKFGHELAVGIERLGLAGSGSDDALNYKEFKKLLKFAADGKDLSEEGRVMERQGDFVGAAAEILKSSFWTWPDDAQGIVASAKPEWANQVFERKLIGEARRVQQRILAFTLDITAKQDELSAIQSKMQDGAEKEDPELSTLIEDSAEKDIRNLVELKRAIAHQEQQLHAYTILNYTGFFKILKKYDKMYRKNGLPPKMESVMPFIDKILNPEAWKSETGVDSSMAKLNDAFDQIMSLLSESPDKSQRLSNLHHSQMDLCEEILQERDESSSQLSSTQDLPQLTWKQFVEQIGSKMTPPLLNAVRATKYNQKSFMADLTAAIIISVAGIPKAMAYATLAGVPVDAGIATLYMPCLVYALLGSSRQVAISPQSVTCLLLAQIVDDSLLGTNLEDSLSERIELTMMYTFTTGVVILMFGLLKLGFLLNFISRPVLSGFVSASALIAVAATAKSLMGLHVKKSPILYILCSRIYDRLPELHWQTSVISFGGIFMFVTLTFLQKRGAKQLKDAKGVPAKAALMVLKVPTVIYLVLAGIFVGSILCSFTPMSPWTKKHIVLGRGATFPALFYDKIIGMSNCELYRDGVQIEYKATGSGDGQQSVLTDNGALVDFAGSDSKPASANLTIHGVQAFPVVRSILCPAVNVPFLHGNDQISLVLDMATVADIFSGKITSWLDERIRKLNPNLPWHSVGGDQQISVIVRADESGTTQAFSEALLRCEGCDAKRFIAGFKVSWGAPKLVEAQGMRGAVLALDSIPWSIGYASFSELSVSNGNSHCAALSSSGGITTALQAWSSPTLAKWPLWHVSHVLVPLAESIRVPSSKPRLESCQARMWLSTFLEELYKHPDTAREFHFDLMPRPQGLDSIKCGASGRRLSLLFHESSKQEGRRLSLQKCSKPKPKCSDVKMVGYIKPSFVKVQMPKPQTQVPVGKMLVDSLLLACIALLEHVANVRLYADRGGYQISTSSDLVAVGLSNMLGCMSGSFIVAGGFSRSALNAKAVTQISLLLSIFVSLAVVYMAAPLLSMLPDAILSTVLFMAVIGLVDWKMVLELLRLRRNGLLDLAALAIAFLATCFLGVVQGMASAIAFSLVVFVFNSSYPQIVELDRAPGTTYFAPASAPSGTGVACLPSGAASAPIRKSGIKVLRFEAPLWFANSSRFLDRMLLELSPRSNLKGLILDMSTVPWVDFSAGVAIKKVISRAAEVSVAIVFANTNEKVESMIRSLAHVEKSFFFESNYSARMSLDSCRLDATGFPATDPSSAKTPAELIIEVIEDPSDSDDESVLPEVSTLPMPIPTNLGQPSESLRARGFSDVSCSI